MPTRVLAFFLACVLLWSGFGTIEQEHALPLPGSGQGAPAILADAPPAAPAEGSVAHHHLDDQPAQSHDDQPAETLAVLPATLRADAGAFGTERPLRPGLQASRAPCLAGLLRPPCGCGSIA